MKWTDMNDVLIFEDFQRYVAKEFQAALDELMYYRQEASATATD